jgi:hypothetical protein
MTRCFFTFLLSLISLTAWARLGYVETRGGKIFEGHVRLESNLVVVANAATEVYEKIALTNIARLSLQSEGVFAPEGLRRSLVASNGALPLSWRSVDVGSVAQAGRVEVRDGLFRVHSFGTNILAQADSFQFVCKPVIERSELLVRVARVQSIDPWARAGVMMREGLAADARQVSLTVTPRRGGVLSWRSQKGVETEVSLERNLVTPCWLKLRRDGDQFTASYSHNGRQWRTLERVSLRMAEECYAGLALTAGPDSEGGIAFENRGGPQEMRRVSQAFAGQGFFEELEEGPSLRNRHFTPQVEWRGGSVQSGWIASMDDSMIRFDPAVGKAPVPTRGVAVVWFQPLPARKAPVIAAGRPGVLLTTGEFVDSELRGVDAGWVTMSSVPLGLLRYDMNTEVVAVVLAKRGAPVSCLFEVTTVDGSRWLGTEVTFEREWVVVREPVLGVRRIPASEMAEFKRNG